MPSKQFGTNLECLTRDRDVQYKTGASANYLYACLLSAPNWWPRFHSCQTISIIHSPPDHLLTLYRWSFELRAKTCGAEITCREHVAVLCSWFTQVLKLPPALTDDAWNEDLRRKLCTRSWNDSWTDLKINASANGGRWQEALYRLTVQFLRQQTCTDILLPLAGVRTFSRAKV